MNFFVVFVASCMGVAFVSARHDFVPYYDRQCCTTVRRDLDNKISELRNEVSSAVKMIDASFERLDAIEDRLERTNGSDLEALKKGLSQLGSNVESIRGDLLHQSRNEEQRRENVQKELNRLEERICEVEREAEVKRREVERAVEDVAVEVASLKDESKDVDQRLRATEKDRDRIEEKVNDVEIKLRRDEEEAKLAANWTRRAIFALEAKLNTSLISSNESQAILYLVERDHVVQTELQEHDFAIGDNRGLLEKLTTQVDEGFRDAEGRIEVFVVNVTDQLKIVEEKLNEEMKLSSIRSLNVLGNSESIKDLQNDLNSLENQVGRTMIEFTKVKRTSELTNKTVARNGEQLASLRDILDKDLDKVHNEIYRAGKDTDSKLENVYRAGAARDVNIGEVKSRSKSLEEELERVRRDVIANDAVIDQFKVDLNKLKEELVQYRTEIVEELKKFADVLAGN